MPSYEVCNYPFIYVETYYTDLCLHTYWDGVLFCTMRSCVLVLALLLLMGQFHAQNPLRRMDPDEWFRMERVQEGWRVTTGVDSVYALRVSFDLGAFRHAAGSDGAWYSREDDMRMVLDSSGASVGRSHNHGFNLESYHFSWHQRYYALGGWGFWNRHSKLLEFLPSTGEWELQPCRDEPPHVNNSASWLDVSGGRIVAMETENLQAVADGEGMIRPIHSLNLSNFSWKCEGMANPLLEVMLTGRRPRRVDLEEYFLFFSLNKAAIIRKKDLMTVITDAFNSEIFIDARSSVDRSKGYLIESSRGGHFFLSIMEGQGGEVVNVLDWDVARAFQQGVAEAFPFVVPLKDADAETSDLVAAQEESWVPPPPLMLLFIVLAFATGYWLSGRSRASEMSDSGPDVPIIPGERGKVGMSPLVSAFLNCGKVKMDTTEFNALIELDEDSSEESKRSRRAQVIRQVNQEYMLVYGQELITRQKDPVDRRRTNYIIRPYSDNA